MEEGARIKTDISREPYLMALEHIKNVGPIISEEKQLVGVAALARNAVEKIDNDLPFSNQPLDVKVMRHALQALARSYSKHDGYSRLGTGYVDEMESKGTANVVKVFRDTVRGLGMREASYSQGRLDELAVLGLTSHMKSGAHSYGQIGARVSKLAKAAIVEANAIAEAEHMRTGKPHDYPRRLVPQGVVDRTIIGNMLIAGVVKDSLVELSVDEGRCVYTTRRPWVGGKQVDEFTGKFGHLGTGEYAYLGTNADIAIGAYDYYAARSEEALNKYKFPPLSIHKDGDDIFKEVRVLATDRGFNPDYRLVPPFPLVADSKLLKEAQALAGEKGMSNHVNTLETLGSYLANEARGLAAERGISNQTNTPETLHSLLAFEGQADRSRILPSDLELNRALFGDPIEQAGKALDGRGR
jgi:hypothetical protein